MMILRKRRRLSIDTLVVLVLLVAAGCVSATPPRTLATADIGPPPVGYESAVRAAIDANLRDPYTAVYTFQRPVRSWFFGEDQIRWAVCGTVNAKNAFGGYVGARPFAVYYRHGKIADAALGNIVDPRAQSDIGSLCGKWHAAGHYE